MCSVEADQASNGRLVDGVTVAAADVGERGDRGEAGVVADKCNENW